MTEKLTDGLQANSVPIYWGGSYVNLDFNTDRVVGVNCSEAADALTDRIMQLDCDDAYCDMLS